MNNFTFKLLALGALALSFQTITAQQHTKQPAVVFGKNVQDSNGFIPCASTEYETYLQKKYPQLNREGFENWIALKIEESKNRFTTKNINTIVTIPVVVHVIHNGDPVGTDENITDEQVLSQIEVLNQDFRRLADTPGFNTHPEGADTEIQFCLAQRDPGGSPTTGIEHINMGTPSWNSFEAIDYIMKAQTQWNPEHYLNIWICKMGGDMEGVGGYAYFPEASGLPGLEGSIGTAEIDGVVLAYYGTGSEDIYPATYAFGRDKGRSATHEIGHFFGLRHIWGDGVDCTATDYCDDTPPAANLNFNCFSYDSCEEDEFPDMIENYMDYTLDDCKNIFTNDQKARMWAVLDNSPRRMSLTTSNSCVFPEDVQLDGSLNIESINGGCDTQDSALIQLTNVGTTTLTQAVISYSIDNGTQQFYNWTGNLATGESEQLTIENIEAVNGQHAFTADITTVNTVTDNYGFNDNKTFYFTASQGGNYETDFVTLTLQPDMFGSEITWSLKNSANETLYSGGPYEDEFESADIITEVFSLTENECYSFIIEDSYGDGICCDGGEGYYTLTTEDDTLIATNGSYDYVDTIYFSTVNTMGSSGFENTAITLHPNPAGNQLYITLSEPMETTYKIYNTIGQLVISGESYQQETLVNTSGLSQGVYIIKISCSGKTQTLKFIRK